MATTARVSLEIHYSKQFNCVLIRFDLWYLSFLSSKVCFLVHQKPGDLDQQSLSVFKQKLNMDKLKSRILGNTMVTCGSLSKHVSTNWPAWPDTLTLSHANNRDTDHPAHLPGLIRAFVYLFLERIISTLHAKFQDSSYSL